MSSIGNLFSDSVLNGIDLKHMHPNPLGSKLNIQKSMVKPGELLNHVRYLTLAKDFVEDITEDGKVRLRINNPEFVKNNRGMIMFTRGMPAAGPAADHEKHTLAVFNQIGGKSPSIDFPVPLGAVDVSDYEHGGNILGDYFQIEAYPTLVYMDGDGHYHHFNGTNGLVSSIKYACQETGSAFCNVIDFEDQKFLEPKEAEGRIVNMNLKF